MHAGKGWNVLVVAALLSGCATAGVSNRIVEEPGGMAMSYSAPRDVGYDLEIWAAREEVSAVVYRRAQCEAQPVRIVHRIRETLKGGAVMERKTLSRKQVAEGEVQSVSCDVGYAARVEVFLSDGEQKFLAGTTDNDGRVSVNLAKLLKVAAYEEVPRVLSVEIRPDQAKRLRSAGELSLAHFEGQRTRVEELKQELRDILQKESVEGASILSGYEALALLMDIAPHDPDVGALSRRFFELNQARKRDEMRGELKKNLDALGEARETLKAMGDAALPLYVQVAVSSGVVDRRALEWSSLRLLRALKAGGVSCASGYSWSARDLGSWDPGARLAAHYTAFAGGSSREAALSRICRGFGN